MKTIAYKWRLSTIKYAYITSSEYRKNGSEPNYNLAFISSNCPSAEEDKIKENVRMMSSDEYRKCFEDMLTKISKDEDGQYIKLKNWEYYYHFTTNESGDNKILYVNATASAKISEDENVYANVVNNNGVLEFIFDLPRGKDGKDGIDGKDGLPGEPVNDGKFNEAIYLLTKNDNYDSYYYPESWFYEDKYQNNDFVPNNWTDRPSGITNEYKYEWVSTRKYSKNDDTNEWEWGKFSTPALMSKWGEDGKDGDGIEYIYKRTKEEQAPTPPPLPSDWESPDSEYQKNSEYVSFLVSEGWTDSPVGLEKDIYKFEWVSSRKQIDNKWQAFSTPALWSTWGKDGDDVEYIFFLNNDNKIPEFDAYDINDPKYQDKEYYPTTNGEEWSDDYVSTTYEKRFSWISNRRKSNGRWGEFSKPVLFNTYKIGGKSFVDLYTRYDSALASNDLPKYDSPIYYSFQEDKYYSDSGRTKEVTTIDSISNLIKWHTDIPVDNTAKMLFKTSALVEIKDNLDELIVVPANSWYGPYLVAANGENAEKMAPYVTLDDDSLSLPIKEDDDTPHENYKYSFNANLYYGDNKLSITRYEVKASNGSKIEINKTELGSDNEELKIEFTINNSQTFTNIELIYIILYGEYENNEIKASGQFKIIPFYSKDAVLYRILLNQDAIFVPSNPCEPENGEIWSTTLTAKVVNSKGEDISIDDTNNKLVYESKKDGLIGIPSSGLTLVGCTQTTGNQIAIPNLPNPLKIIYQANEKTREIEYVNFVNMPLNGIDGISSRLVFAYCSLNEGETPSTPTGGTVDFNNNTISGYPQGALLDSNNNIIEGSEVVWGDNNNLTGVVWLSQCEYFSDGTNDLTWTTPVRLTGFKGLDSVHIELTNDMDQVYVTDGNVIITGQTIETIVSLLNGGDKMRLLSENVIVNNKYFSCDVENINENDVKVTCTLTADTIDDAVKSIDINIEITGFSTFNYFKTFKALVLNGTIDFDLDISPTFIKRNKNEQYSNTQIDVNVTKRDLSTASKTLTVLPYSEWSGNGISVEYYFNNDTDVLNVLSGSSNSIYLPDANNDYNIDYDIDKLTIILKRDNTPIDKVYVECVYDGKDGSSYHLELTNEMDQVYVTDNIVKIDQLPITSEIRLFNGINEANGDIKEIGFKNAYEDICDAKISGVIVDDKITHFDLSIDFKTGVAIDSNIINFEITGITKNDVNIVRTFKVVKLNGTKDYDLLVTPTYVKSDQFGSISTSEISIKVTESDISTENRQITELSTLHDELGIEIKKNGNSVDVTYNNGIIFNDFNNFEYLEVYLRRNGLLVDYVKVEKISDGKDGVDGVSYNMDLSNDYDQVYVTDDKVVVSQTLNTVVYLLNGLEKIDPDQFTVKVDGIAAEGVKTNDNGKKINFDFAEGSTITGKNINYEITIDYGGKTLKKTFKVVKLNGTKDYDLVINPTIIKKDKYGNYTPNEVNINVSESNISTTNRESKNLNKLPDDNWEIRIYNGTLDEYDSYNDNLPFKKYSSGITGYLNVELWSGDTRYDYANIEVVSDGTDGSAYHLELTNEFDQVYTVNKKIIPNQNTATKVLLFNGTQPVDDFTLTLPNEDKYISFEADKNNSKNITITFKDNADIEEKELKYVITATTTDGVNIEKTFKAIVLNGNKDYDLKTSHTYIKKKGDDFTTQEVAITVTESTIGTTDRSITTLTKLPEDLLVFEVHKDGVKIEDVNYGENGFIFDLNENKDLDNSIEVKLYRVFDVNENPILVDYLKIEVLRDGKDGTSPYHIEFSNDMDQVFTTENKVVYEQSVTTDLSLYLGSKIDDTLKFDHIDCEYSESLWTVTGVSCTGGTLTYEISPKIDSELTEKEYDFTFYIKEYGISKKFKLIKLAGTLDYDLYSSHTIIKKHTNGYSTSAVTIEVKESDISVTDKKITTVSTLSGENDLSLKIFVDDVDKTDEITYNSGVTLSLEVYEPNNKILVELYRGGDLIDFIDIEVVSDGKDGDPGADGTNIEFIYILCDDESDLNSNIIPNFSGLVNEDKDVILNDKRPEDWGDKPWWTDHPYGITKEKQMEACSQRIKEYGSKDWGEWCTPFPWAKWGDDGIDGDGVEYIFYMSDRDNVPGNPGAEIESKLSKYDDDLQLQLALTEIVNTFDFFPGEKWITGNTGLTETIRTKYGLNESDFSAAVNSLDFNWTDDPSDVGPFEPVEWVSIRRKKVNPDGTFTYQYTDPTIWAEWKRDTYDSITEFMFTVDSRDLSGCIISGGTWNDLKNKTSSAITFVDTSIYEDVKWYDSVPKHDSINQYVWMVKGYASGEITYTTGVTEENGSIYTGITYSPINWTSPTKMIDSQFMQVEYSCIEGNGEIPNPINLSEIISGHNLTLEDIEIEFRNADKANNRTDWVWKNSNELDGTPVWMITSTFYNGEWSNWTVSRIKGEQGPKGDTGQGVSIKGSFKNEDELIYAYYYYMQDKNNISESLKEEIALYKGNNNDKVENGKLKTPSKYFLNNELILGDSYIVDECTINGETFNGYLFVYVFENDTYIESWEPVGQVRGDSSYIYIVYASSVTINNDSSKTYHLTEGGTYSDDKTKYYGTTPGKYIGIHAATQQYEGHPYPEKLYGVSARTNDSEFIWSKWEGDDGFGQEQIFILSGETAPKVPVYDNKISGDTGITIWNRNDFVPDEWSDKPLTPTLDYRCCWMAVRKYPFNGEGINNFSGETDGTAILFSRYSIDGDNGSSPFHLELSNEMEQVYTMNNTIIVPQTASTTITLFEGTSGITLNESNVVVTSEATLTGVTVTGNDGSLTINRVYSTGETLTNDEEQIKIRISADTLTSSLDYDIVRTFKVIRLNGTKDYDLNVTPTFIKKDKDDNLSHSSITISINESEISSTNREIKQTTGVPSGYTLSFSIDDGKYNEIYYKSTSTVIPIRGINNYCNIKLIKDAKTVDSVTVEILKDGKDGISGSSPYHVELSNDFDLISTINGKVNGEQTYTTKVELYEGDEPRTISDIDVLNSGEWDAITGDTDGCKEVKITFTGGTSFVNTINPVIKVNGKHNGYVTIKPMEGVALYQLESNTGFVTKGKTTDINIAVKQKTNDGLIDVVVDDLPSDMGIYVYHDNKTEPFTSVTKTTVLKYTYSGTSISEIDFRLKRGDVIYDNINVEVKNDIKAFGSLNLNPLEKVVYVDNYNIPMVSSLTFDASFIYEGQQIDLTSTALTITVTGNSSNTNDFNTGVTKTVSTLTIDYNTNRTIEKFTKEKYIFISEYDGDTYENEFYVTYIKRNFEIMSDGDTIYVPKETNMTISRKLGLNVVYNGSNITKDCRLSSTGETSGVTFNQRAGIWYANIPKGICENTGITDLDVVIENSGLTETKKYTLIRGEETNDYWFINVSPKYLSTDSAPIEIYLTKNSYEGNYISLEDVSIQNVKLYYIIDGECINVDEDGNEIAASEICYSNYLEYAPKEHGNNAFYPNGILKNITTDNKNELGGVVETVYTQEPIYSSIEFKLYYEPNGGSKELLASEIVERYDVIRDSKMAAISLSGLKIDARDLFEDYDSEKYDIVIKEIKK